VVGGESRAVLSELFVGVKGTPVPAELSRVRVLFKLLGFLLSEESAAAGRPPDMRTISVYNGEGLDLNRHNEEKTMERKASAVWKGGLKDGKGTISAPGGVLKDTQYSFTSRFENGPGTNPEELIAAAHAACFSMALSAQLGGANLTPESISTNVTLTMEKLDSGWTITSSHIDVVGKVPGADAAAFQKYAEAAEKGCPVSKVLNAKISMTAKLG
jgi:lipoyl-dependent peroxiredoxin